jgi:hypothetical protein
MNEFKDYGSIGADYNFADKDKVTEVSYIWNSLEATGLSSNL